MDLRNLSELEWYFADHLDTELFPVLADLYFQNNDLRRARKVCQIGLGYHPHHPEGHYLLAKVALAEGNLKEAEKALKFVLQTGVPHLSAAVELAQVQEQLGRADTTVTESWKRVIALDPTHPTAQERIKQAAAKTPAATDTATAEPQAPSSKTIQTPPSAEPKEPPAGSTETYHISPRLATFTMVAVLRNQGLHYQALEVLKVLESKGEDPQRIAQERQAIKDELHLPE